MIEKIISSKPQYDENGFYLDNDGARYCDYGMDTLLCIDENSKKIYMNVHLDDMWITAYRKELGNCWEYLDLDKMEKSLIKKAEAFYRFIDSIK